MKKTEFFDLPMKSGNYGKMVLLQLLFIVPFHYFSEEHLRKSGGNILYKCHSNEHTLMYLPSQIR